MFIYLLCPGFLFTPLHIRMVCEHCGIAALWCFQRSVLQHGGRRGIHLCACGWGRAGAALSPLSSSVVGEQWWDIRQWWGDWGEIWEWRKWLFPQQEEKEKTEGKEGEKNQTEKEGWRGGWWWWRAKGTKDLFILSWCSNIGSHGVAWSLLTSEYTVQGVAEWEQSCNCGSLTLHWWMLPLFKAQRYTHQVEWVSHLVMCAQSSSWYLLWYWKHYWKQWFILFETNRKAAVTMLIFLAGFVFKTMKHLQFQQQPILQWTLIKGSQAQPGIFTGRWKANMILCYFC